MKTTDHFCTTGNADHTIYGGTVYKRDFDAHSSISEIASRIISDWSFDNQCCKNIEIRNNSTIYKKGGK